MARVLEILDEQFGGPVGWLEAQGFDPAPLRRRLAESSNCEQTAAVASSAG